MSVLAAGLKKHQLLQRPAVEDTLKGPKSLTSQGRRL